MRIRNFVVVLFGILLGAFVAHAQQITGQIRGTVKDAAGAVVPDALITVTNLDTKQVIRRLHTDHNGDYVAVELPVAHYSVAVEVTGFSKLVKTGIVINAGDQLTEDIALQMGAVTETVTVAAESTQVNQETNTVEGLIEGTQVRELPLNNNNYEQLLTLQPGVSSGASDQIYVGTTNPTGGVNTVNFSVNGARQSDNNWTIDGADNVDHGSNITLLVYPSIEAISEFKVERSSYSPEFGRSAGGQVNVITRSGTHDFHGGVFEFFRNDVLNANKPYHKHISTINPGQPRDILRYNDFGGTFGGPIFIPGHYNGNKDKTFFFFSEEVRRVTTPVTESSGGAPTSQLLQGQFSSTVCIQIDNPTDGNCTATGTSISPTKFNPIAAAYIKDIYSKVPLSSTAGNYNLIASKAGIFNFREELYRLDQVITPKISAMFRFIRDDIPTTEPFGLFGPQASLPNVGTTKTNSPGDQWMGRVSEQITGHIFNETGFAYSYGAIVSDPTGLLARQNSPDVAALADGAPGTANALPYKVTLNRIPSLVFDDGDTQGGFGQYRDYNRNYNLFDNLDWTFGKHATKWGMSYIYYQKQENAAGNNSGTYEFGSTNALDSSVSFEQDWANFLLGYADSSFSQSATDFTADVRQNLWEFYGQDTWRVSPALALNYGIRYSYFETPYEMGKNLTSFDQNLYKPANAPTVNATGFLSAPVLPPSTSASSNGWIVSGINSPFGDYVTSQEKTNVAPRVGVAWDPWRNGRTSIRGGYGLFYNSVAAGLVEDNVFNNAYDNSLGSDLSHPSVGGATPLPPSLYGTAPNWKTPYTRAYNFDVQKEVGNGWMVDIGYVGTDTKHQVGVIDINQVKRGAAAGAGLLTPDNLNARGVLSGSTSVARKLNSLRPYLGFTQIGQISPIFRSNYNALQASLDKHFGEKGTLGVFYTWSKNLTNNQTDRSTGTMYTYCIECDYGRASLDRRHNFVANYIYNTPWFKNDNFTGRFLGDWEVTGILTVNSGLPFTSLGNSTLIGDPLGTGYRADGSGYGRVASIRPMQIGNPNKGMKTFDNWFDTSAFQEYTPTNTISNERRGVINGPGLWRYDMSLVKNFRIFESLKGQFRVSSFNLFNHTNPSSIGASFSGKIDPATLLDIPNPASTYGKVTNTRDGRTLQLAMKMTF